LTPNGRLEKRIVVRSFWFGADDGARAVGATDDDDVGFAGSGWWRWRGATYGVDRSTMANSQAMTWMRTAWIWAFLFRVILFRVILFRVHVSLETPEYTANADGVGTLRLLEGIRTLGLKDVRFYQASTSEMYGNTPAPQSETYPAEDFEP
jgi:hypothetical protein